MDGQTDVGYINLIGGLVTRNPPKKDSFELAITMGNTIVSGTHRTLQRARRSARQAFYFIKYN